MKNKKYHTFSGDSKTSLAEAANRLLRAILKKLFGYGVMSTDSKISYLERSSQKKVMEWGPPKWQKALFLA